MARVVSWFSSVRRLALLVLGVGACIERAPAFPPTSDASAAGGGSDAMAAGADTRDALAVDETCPVDSDAACPPAEYATWPMPNSPGLPLPNPGTFTVKATTAIDNVTGLEWQRESAALETWAAALARCAALQLGERDDWRLPSRIELVSIIDPTRRPTLDPTALGGATPNDYFWSSTTTAFDANLAYSVYFGAGLTAYGNKSGASAHTRCVRGGRPGVLPRFFTTAELVNDRNTRLSWQRIMPEHPLSLNTAVLYCEELTLGGHSDWRLPSMKELQTIVDERRHMPALDPALFPGAPTGRYWSSTPAGSMAGSAIYFEAGDATSEIAAANESYHVRCVRSVPAS